MAGRRFGFELEFDSNRINQNSLKDSFATSLQEHDPTQRIVNRETVRSWTMKSDGSCGWEVTSPVLSASPSTFRIIRQVVNGARRQIAGQRVVRRNCGFHVHIDVCDLNNSQIINLVRIFHSFERCFLKLQPQSRRDNGYCRRIASDPIPSARHYADFDPDDYDSRSYGHLSDHSSAVSFCHFQHRGTIEIRYAAGTIRASKIVNWIKTLLYCVEIAKSIENFEIINTESIEDLCDFISENPTNIRWMENHKERVIQWINARARELTAPAAQAEAV
jgi:hypothetical protein